MSDHSRHDVSGVATLVGGDGRRLRWHVDYGDDDTEVRESLTIPASGYPPGTTVTIRRPRCRVCGTPIGLGRPPYRCGSCGTPHAGKQDQHPPQGGSNR